MVLHQNEVNSFTLRYVVVVQLPSHVQTLFDPMDCNMLLPCTLHYNIVENTDHLDFPQNIYCIVL